MSLTILYTIIIILVLIVIYLIGFKDVNSKYNVVNMYREFINKKVNTQDNNI